MRIQYETRLDEIVDVQLRLLKRSKVARAWLWRGAGATVVVISAVIFAALALLPAPGPLPVRIALVGGYAVISMFVYPILYRKGMTQRVRKFLREQLGSEGPFPFQLELTEEGIWTKLASTQITFAWTSVTSVEDTPDALEFRTRDGGIVVVRERAFASAEDRRRFTELARDHMALAHASQRAGSGS